MSLTLPPEFESFVSTRVAAGAYPSEDEVLRAAFSLLEQREKLLEQIDEGTAQLRSGGYIEYGLEDRERFLKDIESTAKSYSGTKESP
jgi:putative addiction module CopG family antidote